MASTRQSEDRADVTGALELLVYHKGPELDVEMVPGERWRDWMNATDERFANRCLPLLMANQSGWVARTPAAFAVHWDGADEGAGMTVEYDGEPPREQRVASSHFGYGILTFSFHSFMRTPAGYNLLVRGPANSPKDGIAALEGLVETDWGHIPFTMNWKLTRPGSVRFEAGEPFCQIVPQRRGELERFRPRARSLADDADAARKVDAWAGARGLFKLGKRLMADAGEPKYYRKWLDDYFKGRTPSGEQGEEHQTTLRLSRLS